MEIPIIGEKVNATEVSEFFDDINERYELKVMYYEKQSSVLVAILRLITLGLFALFEQWFIYLRLWSYKRTIQPSHLLIRKSKNGQKMSRDELITCKFDGERIKFRYQYINYVINSQNRLQKLELLTYDQQELSKYEAQQRQTLFGENIMQIEERTKSQILIHEILSPFNIFQVFSFIIWSLDEYYLYAALIAVLTAVQIYLTLHDLDQQNRKIRQMIYFETNVIVHRDQRKWHISSKDLVPGDIVEVNGSVITYDGVLILGEAVFNEAILTGEGTPVLKTSDMQVFSGCTCIQASQDCLAMVQQISFNTVKGSLARYILFNNAYQYSFQKESLKYLLVLGILGLILSVVNYFIRIQTNTSKFNTLIEALEIFTIMIPPSLPTALGAGLQVAIQRLQNHSIFCIKPDKINVSGMVDMIGFDKTGTLTESTLKVLGCIELKQLMNPNQCSETMQLALKSCHSLVGGCGDSLEIAMLECCTVNFNYECLKVYQFEAHLQRMTVIIRHKGRMFAITKGSPEIMERLCFQTLPEQYQFLVKNYSQEGYRLITFGYKLINDQNEERKYIENGLQYLGILVFMNNLREDAKDLIHQLNQNNIKVFMVTGDNVLTSINVAKKCHILDPNKPVIVGEVIDEKLVFGENTDILEVEQMDYQVALTGESWGMVNKVYNCLYC